MPLCTQAVYARLSQYNAAYIKLQGVRRGQRVGGYQRWGSTEKLPLRRSKRSKVSVYQQTPLGVVSTTNPTGSDEAAAVEEQLGT